MSKQFVSKINLENKMIIFMLQFNAFSFKICDQAIQNSLKRSNELILLMGYLRPDNSFLW